MNPFKPALLICLAALLGGLVGCQPQPITEDPASGLTRVSLQLNWYPEAEHGGFYAALVHGYFREAGLDVEILPGGPETPVLQQVASGRATFGVANADNILYGRAQQAPVVALMAPLQTSPRCIMVHKSSGIREFSELKNMTLGLSTTQAFSFYLRKHVPLTGVEIVPYPGNVARFLVDEHYGQQGYVFSEPYLASKHGADPTVLMLADLGFNPYTSLLFTREQTLADAPDLVRRMKEACVRGWQKYLKDPAETNAYIHKCNPEMDLDVLEYGAQAIVPLAEHADAAAPFGQMTLPRWQTLIDQLVECDQIPANAVKAEEAFVEE